MAANRKTLAGDPGTIWEKLRNTGIRVTKQRKAILEVLINRNGNHLCAEEICQKAAETEPGLGLATVYRTLALFEEAGIVRSTDFGDGRARYELADVASHHHHHLICVSCGRIEEVEQDLLQQIESDVEMRHGFSVTNHLLKLYGLCKNCRDKTGH